MYNEWLLTLYDRWCDQPHDGLILPPLIMALAESGSIPQEYTELQADLPNLISKGKSLHLRRFNSADSISNRPVWIPVLSNNAVCISQRYRYPASNNDVKKKIKNGIGT